MFLPPSSTFLLFFFYLDIFFLLLFALLLNMFYAFLVIGGVPFWLFSPLALGRAARVFYIWKEPLTKSAGILVSFPPQSFHVRRALTLPVVENYLGTTSSPSTSFSFRT